MAAMMDRTGVARSLEQIASYLELRGENRFKIGAYEKAARAVQRLAADDLRPLLRSGALAATPGIGPATLTVVTDLIETGESSYLERLRAEVPEGLLELARIPGLGIPRIQKIHEALGISTVEELEAAARDGRIAALPRFSAKTAAGILAAIEKSRAAGTQRRIADALDEAEGLLDGLPDDYLKTYVRRVYAVTPRDVAQIAQKRFEVPKVIVRVLERENVRTWAPYFRASSATSAPKRSAVSDAREALMRTIARISESRNQVHQIEIAVEKCEFYLGKLNETARKVSENVEAARDRMVGVEPPVELRKVESVAVLDVPGHGPT